jgi:hypothetical protein
MVHWFFSAPVHLKLVRLATVTVLLVRAASVAGVREVSPGNTNVFLRVTLGDPPDSDNRHNQSPTGLST